MSYREVTMIEVKEVVRLWLAGTGKKRIAAQRGLDVKTVRRYVREAERIGLKVGAPSEFSDEHLAAILIALKAPPVRERGEAWASCQGKRAVIEKWLKGDVRLSKCQRLLRRQGVDVPYGTLYRFAVQELGFGGRAPTVRIADGEPGKELEMDTGWMTHLEPDASGKKRRFRAFIFTPNVSRYRFVFPSRRERTEDAIRACEAAWEFYGGIFEVLVIDNSKAIVKRADALEPTINRTFLEYSQARGFFIDTTRVRTPTDKPRVERSVRDVRDDCFGGEKLGDLEGAARRALYWSKMEYGMRRHSTTHRLPREHFESVEAAHLGPAPTEPYDIPLWCDPKVARDHFAQVDKALYTLPTRWIGYRVQARADRSLVRFYYRGELIKTHPRKAPGERSIDENDYPEHLRPYAMRDITFLQRQADQCGAAVGRFAALVLEGPLPWTRMRRVYALLSLVRRYGEGRVEAACALALEHQMLNVRRLQNMLKNPPPAQQPAAERPVPPARYLRDPRQYALLRGEDHNQSNPSVQSQGELR